MRYWWRRRESNPSKSSPRGFTTSTTHENFSARQASTWTLSLRKWRGNSLARLCAPKNQLLQSPVAGQLAARHRRVFEVARVTFCHKNVIQIAAKRPALRSLQQVLRKVLQRLLSRRSRVVLWS